MDGERRDQPIETHISSENMAAGRRSNNKVKPTYYSVQKKNVNISFPAESARILQQVLGNKMAMERKSDAVSVPRRSASYEDLSTDDILKMARETLIQRKNFDVATILFDGSTDDSNSSLPPQKSDDFELAKLFQGSALRFSNREFEKAKWLLNICQSSASPSGNALHRIVYYFSAALKERIARELGGKAMADVQGKNVSEIGFQDEVKYLHPDWIKSHLSLPLCQVTDFTAIQALVENVASAKRVHLIDLGIRGGSHWPIMIQALAARHEPVELLKLTAIGKSEDYGTGRMLSSLAESMNIPFEYRLIVSDLKDLTEDMFELSDDEVVAVYSEKRLASLLSSPDHLVSLLRTIEKLNPCVMVVIEFEASTDTPIFLDRFDGFLSVCAAAFDCLEDCMERDNPCRAFIEGGLIWDEVRNVIICEGEERIIRHERLEFWRDFLSRFGFVEVALSDAAFFQIDMVLKRNHRWGSCTVDKKGKGILIGWKKNPIKSLSVWKFQHE